MSINNPSINFLIASIGRPTLKNTLRSLYGQFSHGLDKVYVYFDGRCDAGMDFFNKEQELYGDDLIMIMLPENLGSWGHGIRNKFQRTLPGDYIHNADDDDEFLPGVFGHVKNDLKENYGKVIIYKVKADGGWIWTRPIIEYGQISTASGLIFNRPEIFGDWGDFYGGDYHFWEQVQDNIGKENIVFKDTYIYITKPHIKGYR